MTHSINEISSTVSVNKLITFLKKETMIPFLPEGISILEEWGEVLSQSSRERNYDVVIEETEGSLETYTLEVDVCANMIHTFEWDICKAYQIINEHSLKKERFVVKDILHSIYESGVHPVFKPSNLQNPVIFINYEPSIPVEFRCINGNHRIVHKYKGKRKYVEGFFFKDSSHVNFMTSEFDKALYLMMMDTKSLNEYAVQIAMARQMGHKNIPSLETLYDNIFLHVVKSNMIKK